VRCPENRATHNNRLQMEVPSAPKIIFAKHDPETRGGLQ
jgi:hypothetical protein